MNLWQAFKMAFRSIWGNKGRSVLTMLGIIIGVAAVMTIVSILQGMNKQTMEMYESMGTNTINVYAYSYSGIPLFDEIYQYCLQLDDLVEGVTPTGYLNTKSVIYGVKNSVNFEGNMQTVLASHQYAMCNNFQIAKGRDLSKIDIDNYSNVCVMGSSAAQYFFDLADPLNKTLMVNGIPFTVVGVYAQKDTFNPVQWSMDNVIIFPYTATRALGQSNQDMSEFVVKAKNAEASIQVSTKLTGFLTGLLGDPNNPNATQKGNFSVYNPSSWQDQTNTAMLTMTLVLGGIAGISLLVGGIGIMNIMLVTVTERTKEIGVRRAIGARRKSIITQFLIEAGMICGVGGLLGAGLGTVFTIVGSQLLLKQLLLPSLLITLGAMAFSIALGIIFGLYPAIKASGLQPVVALRTD